MTLGFPLMDSVKDLLTGSIVDRFKALIEPHAMVNTGIFLTLNLAWVFPPLFLARPDLPLIASVNNLATNWQIVFATIGFFVLSYLFHNLSNAFLAFARGRFFENSIIIGPMMKQAQVNKYSALKDLVENPDLPGKDSRKKRTKEDKLKMVAEKRNSAANRLAYYFPFDKDELGLTALDNALLNPASYVKHQYGATIELIWPVIQGKLGDDNKGLKSLQENWGALVFFSSLQTLLVIVAVELLLVSAYLRSLQWIQLLIVLVCSVLSYLVTLQRALQWGQDLRRLFDLNIKIVLGELGLETVKGLQPVDGTMKETIHQMSRWLVYGAMADGDLKKQVSDVKLNPEWYQSIEKPSLVVKHPISLNVEQMKPLYEIEKDDQAYPGYKQAARYVFAISNTNHPEQWDENQDAYVLVLDPDFPDPVGEVSGKILAPMEKEANNEKIIRFEEKKVVGLRQDGEPAGLLFPLKDIPPGGSCILRYTAYSDLVRITCNDQLVDRVDIKKWKPGGYKVILTMKPSEKDNNVEVSLKLQDSTRLELYLGATCKGAEYKTELDPACREGKWNIKVPAGISRNIVFSITDPEEA